MKAIGFTLVALCAQVGLAIPHGRFNAFLRHSNANSPFQDHHQHLHARAEVTQINTITDVVTVTASNAVVWVDQHGAVLSTDYHGEPSAQTKATNTHVVSSVASSTSIAVTSSMQSTTQQGNLPSFSSQPLESASSSSAQNTYVPSTTQGSSAPASSAVPSTPGENLITDMSGLGICYELIDNAVQCKSRATMDSEFSFLKSQGYTKVRVYDIGCPLGDVAGAAGAQGLALIAGINTVSNVAGDIAKLISMLQGNWASVDTIVVGNEVVNGNPGLAGAVVAAIATARGLLSAAGFNGHVVTVDTFIAHSNHPQLCASSDYCAVNAHAYFDPNTSATQAGDFVLNTAIGMVKKIAGGKTIVITESGWPHAGSANGAAVPSVQNQQIAIAALKSQVASAGYGLFLFQAYDATYKQPGALGVEQFFGIYGH